jgi:hypothetical protein
MYDCLISLLAFHYMYNKHKTNTKYKAFTYILYVSVSKNIF